MYQTAAKGGSACFGSLSGQIGAYDSFGMLITKAYMPWYWSEVMVNFQDVNAMTSSFYVDCKMDKLLFSLSRLASTEGLIQLGARGAGSIFQIMNFTSLISDESTAGAQTIGKAFGKLAGAILDFKI
jgi:hypothetical protein